MIRSETMDYPVVVKIFFEVNWSHNKLLAPAELIMSWSMSSWPKSKQNFFNQQRNCSEDTKQPNLLLLKLFLTSITGWRLFLMLLFHSTKKESLTTIDRIGAALTNSLFL